MQSVNKPNITRLHILSEVFLGDLTYAHAFSLDIGHWRCRHRDTVVTASVTSRCLVLYCYGMMLRYVRSPPFFDFCLVCGLCMYVVVVYKLISCTANTSSRLVQSTQVYANFRCLVQNQRRTGTVSLDVLVASVNSVNSW